MHRFWETIIQPLLETIHPQRIVEIGADQGLNTKKLLTFCDQPRVQVEVIDPLPRFDVEAWQEQYKGRLRIHQMLSLNAIPRLEKFEAVLIDGDHNWYTVFHELKLIEIRSAELTQPFPIVFLHDIGWPYGRRDLYYNPDTIPDVYRKPYKKKGMRPETPELLEEGGINPHLNNAIYENNLQNGVLTAVENFLHETKEHLELIKIPGFHGFGILIPGLLLERNSQFSQCVTQLRIPQVLSQHVERVEVARIALDLQRRERETALREFQATVKRTEATLQQQLTEAEHVRVTLEQSKTAEVKALQQRLTEAEHVRVTLEQSKTAEVKALQQRLTEAEHMRVTLEQSKTAEVKALQQRLTEAEQKRVADMQTFQQLITKSDQERSALTAEAQTLRQQIAEGGQEQERLQRSVWEKAADIVELQKGIEKTKKDLDVAQHQAEEGRTFQIRFREAERIRAVNNQEIAALRTDVKEQVQEIDSLVRHVGKLDRTITSILESKRWELGDRLGAYYRKIRFKSALSNPQTYQEQMRKELQNWLQARKKKDHALAVPNSPQVILSLPQPSVAAQSKLPSVDIVICVHNALEDVKACLSSVVAQASVPFTLYLVNDGSDAPTTDFLRQFSAQYPFCTLLESPTAEGYTRAANRGLRASTAAYVVMLNSDTIVPAAWLECLLECGSSDPRIGIVGPLSNAASWQSIPDCLSPTGDWAINSLPPGLTVEDMALLVRALSPQRFPRVPFINGFCFIIKRDVISAIGLFDEERFPKGYGEENDYCLRAADAGFSLAVADNAYVYHAKSKSYGYQTRETLAKQGSAALREKHGQTRITELVQEIRNNPLLAEFRQTVSDYLVGKPVSPPGSRPLLRLLFLLPVRGGGGGAHSVVQEAQGMRKLGVYVQIASKRDYKSDLTQQYAGLNETDDLFYFYNTDEKLVAYASRFQIVIATIYHSVSLMQKIVTANPSIMPAYYVQDYEPLFFDSDSKRREEARKSYTLVSGTVLFAKTQWLCETVESAHGVKVEKVKPSLDHKVYNPLLSSVSRLGPVRIAAMIRPATPRRGAARTMLLLKRLKMTQQEYLHIDIFGCELSDPYFQQLQHDFEFQQHGVLTREGVAELLRHAEIFIDLSDYQAFGRTGLEAMACGCAVVLPRAGGVHEYAVDRENALVVDTASDEQCYAALVDLVRDADLRRKLASNALVTAKEYSIEKSVLSEVVMLQDQWRARQETSGSSSATPPTSHVQVSSRLRILGLLPLRESGEFPASSYIRVILPLQHPSLQDHFQFSPVSEAELLAADGDILVVQRTAIPDVQAAHRLLAHCRRRNIRLVYELDDNLFAIPGHHVQAKAYHRAMQPAMTILSHVDLLVVVSEKLQEKARDFNRKVRVLPNALDERLWIAGTSHMPSGKGEATIRILYMGSQTHANDLLVIKKAMIRLTQEYGTRVTLDVVGGVAVGEEQPWFHTFSHPPQARVNYPGFVEWFRTAPPWQIGVIPLADTEFNRSKSYIKYLDYSALGLATLCSNIEPYQGVVCNGINGFLVENSPEAWYHALKRLIEEPSLRTTLGQAAYEGFVQNHTLKTQARKWLDTYRQALNSK